ncbi:MAG: nucleoside phosphorylase [Chloroflexota bacterium]|nr:nucleoside phosphorylase [Chloroflexota bacterium]
MSVPNLESKLQDRPILTAVEMLAHRRQRSHRLDFPPPEAVMLCYQSAWVDRVIQTGVVRKSGGFIGDLHLLKKTRGKIAIASGFGIGAPVVAALMEEFVAFGVRRFLSIGLAGALQSGLNAGDLVVCTRALRDEGTSHHYLPDSKYASASETMIAALRRALDAGGRRYTLGTSWTTDAPYRETRGEVEQYRSEQVQTVEMEAAALFAVGQRLGVQVGAAFVIGDTLDGLRWRIDFDARAAERGWRILFDAAVVALGDLIESK